MTALSGTNALSARARAIAAASLLALVASWTLAIGSDQPVAAAPGTPGVPGDPVVLFHEDFENVPDTGASTALDSYVSLGGYTYTSDAAWNSQADCNGFVMSQGNTQSAGQCNDSTDSWGGLGNLANVLGQVNGSTPGTNSAVAAYTGGTAFAADLIEFSTDGETIPLPTPNRFITFSVNAAAVSCWAAQPQLTFALLAGGVETPISGASINPCTDPRAQAYAPTNEPGSAVFYAAELASDGSFLSDGSPVGIVMRNGSGATAGNDGAFDDIKLLDVTPQLDKSFAPASVPVGGVSTLTLTVTNTSELASKDGWSFVDTFPAGLVVADPANLGGTCDATVAAPAGGSTVTVTDGVLEAGEVSCTITVDVTSSTPTGSEASPRTYENCAANISQPIGVDLPACASVEFFSTPALELVKTSSAGDVVAVGDIVTYTVEATNVGNGDYTASSPATVTDDLTEVLDDAGYRGDATATAGTVVYASPRLTWSGPLAVGESVTISYSVRVGVGGDRLLRNVVFEGEPTDPTPECADPAESPVPCDSVETPVTPSAALASTGLDVRAAIPLGVLLLAGGGALLLRRRVA